MLESPNLGCVLLLSSISLTRDARDILRLDAISFRLTQKGVSSEIEVECFFIVIDRFIIMSIYSCLDVDKQIEEELIISGSCQLTHYEWSS